MDDMDEVDETEVLAAILIVDDEEPARSGLEKALSHVGYEVATAASGAEALEYLRSQPCDAMIADVRMPNMNGLQLLRLVKQRYPGIAVVMLTAVGMKIRTVRETALRYEAFAVLEKPVRLKVLEAVLRVALGLRDTEVSIADIAIRDVIQLKQALATRFAQMEKAVEEARKAEEAREAEEAERAREEQSHEAGSSPDKTG